MKTYANQSSQLPEVEALGRKYSGKAKGIKQLDTHKCCFFAIHEVYVCNAYDKGFDKDFQVRNHIQKG